MKCTQTMFLKKKILALLFFRRLTWLPLSKQYLNSVLYTRFLRRKTPGRPEVAMPLPCLLFRLSRPWLVNNPESYKDCHYASTQSRPVDAPLASPPQTDRFRPCFSHQAETFHNRRGGGGGWNKWVLWSRGEKGSGDCRFWRRSFDKAL